MGSVIVRRTGMARIAAGLALAAVSLLSAAAPALAIPGWTGPTSLGTADAWSSRLGVDANGRLHIVAMEDSGLVYRTNKSGTWKTTQLTFELKPWQDELSMAVDPSGHVYVAWATGCDCSAATTTGIDYLTNASGGRNAGWPEVPRTIVTGKATEPAIQVVGGKVHLAYRMGGRIHYLTNATSSGGWRDALVSPKGTFARLPSITVHPTKGARIAYVGRDGIVVATNTGTALNPVFRRGSIPGSAGTAPSVALDAQGRIHVAWAAQALACGAVACGASGPAAADVGVFLVRRAASDWVPVAAKRRVSASGWTTQLAIDQNGAFHVFDGAQVISNASGTLVRALVVPSFINDTASLAVTGAGRSRVVYLDDTDASGTTQSLFLVTED